LFQVDVNEITFPLPAINRLFLYTDSQAERVHMQALSSEDQEVIEIETTFSLKDFERIQSIGFDSYPRVINVNETPNKTIHEGIYIPEQPVTAQKLSYTVSPISGEFFRQTLFIDPDSVKYY